jgi:hypothetical protein
MHGLDYEFEAAEFLGGAQVLGEAELFVRDLGERVLLVPISA